MLEGRRSAGQGALRARRDYRVDVTAPEQPQLRRALGFWALAIYGIGDILGAGIYAVVGKVAGVAGSASWLSFVVALSVAALTAFTYAELGGRFPRSAGEAVFSYEAFGRRSLALLVGFVVLCSGVVSLATVSVAFAGYMTGFVPGVPSGVTITAVLILLAAINLWGIRQSSNANIFATMLEFSGLLIVIIAGLWYLSHDQPIEPFQLAEPSEDSDWGAVARGAALAFFAFIGFEDMVNVAEEVKRPERNLPLAIITALAVTGVMYLLVIVIATSVVSPSALAASDAPLLSVVRRAAPALDPRLFTAIALFAVANTGLLNFIMASRLLYGMSRQGLLPSWLGTVHERRQTPHWAILAILVLALVLGLSGTLTYLAGTTSLLLLLVFFSVNLSLVVIKRRSAGQAAGFRVPWVVPVLGAGSCLALMPFVPLASLWTAGVVLALGVVLVLYRRAAQS